jgi:hypothetical protein
VLLKKSNFSVGFVYGASLTHPTVDIVVRTVFIVDYRLIVTKNVKTEAIGRAVVVEENAGEEIGVI